MLDRVALILLAILAFSFLSSGLGFLFFSAESFARLPAYYGEFNVHFVRDAGLAFIASGVLLASAVLKPQQRRTLLFSGSLFVVLHSSMHLHMLLTGKIPKNYWLFEISLIIAPAIFLCLLLAYFGRREKQY